MSRLFIILAVFCVLSACSHEMAKKVEGQKQRVGHVESKSAMVQRMRSILEKSSSLTDKQKEQFLEVHDRIVADAAEINEDIRKLKIVLFQNMTKENFNKKKMGYLTSKIKGLYESKLDLMIEGFIEVKEILGVQAKDFFESDAWSYDHLDYNTAPNVPQNHYIPYPDQGHPEPTTP